MRSESERKLEPELIPPVAEGDKRRDLLIPPIAPGAGAAGSEEIMYAIILLIAYLSAFSFVVGLFPPEWEHRPKLQGLDFEKTKERRKDVVGRFFRKIIRAIAQVNKPLCAGILRRRLAKDLSMGHVDLTPEEFFLIKEAGVVGILALSYNMVTPDIVFFWVCMSLTFGYMLPEFWLKGRVKTVKNSMIKELPDAIDLLGLCVNAGLDFMLALKWVIEKSPPSVFITELNIVLQEINVGKTRRDSLKDLAVKYDLPDLSTFSRTLIQADKMGTSVSEALNILSEDMRLARYRRGEQLALKAPLKMLVPLLFFILPVVGILVAAPILLDFTMNNPMSKIGGG